MRWKSCPADALLSQEASHEAVLPFLSHWTCLLPNDTSGRAQRPALGSVTLGKKSSEQNDLSSLFASCFPHCRRGLGSRASQSHQNFREELTPFHPRDLECSAPGFCFNSECYFWAEVIYQTFISGGTSLGRSLYPEPSFHSICSICISSTSLPNLAETGKYVLHRNNGERGEDEDRALA